MKGRAWQGFAPTFGEPGGSDVWGATAADFPGSHVQTVHDTGNWKHVDYVFPAEDKATGEAATLGDGSPIPAAMHLMFETFDGSCDATFIDDIVGPGPPGSTNSVKRPLRSFSTVSRFCVAFLCARGA